MPSYERLPWATRAGGKIRTVFSEMKNDTDGADNWISCNPCADAIEAESQAAMQIFVK